MRANKNKIRLPIGRTARLAFQLEALRLQCSQAADGLMKQKQLDEAELDECAALDDALAAAHRILKATLTRITIARIQRRIKANRSRKP